MRRISAISQKTNTATKGRIIEDMIALTPIVAAEDELRIPAMSSDESIKGIRTCAVLSNAPALVIRNAIKNDTGIDTKRQSRSPMERLNAAIQPISIMPNANSKKMICMILLSFCNLFYFFHM